MPLEPIDRQNIINYRIERSYTTLKEALYNAEGKYWNLVANRLYYSVFYMCEALLLSKNISANTHAGVRSMMGMHFIKTEKLSIEDGKLLSQLFTMRQTGDYDDLFDWKKEDLDPLFPKVEDLLNKIKVLIDNISFER